MPGGEQFHGPVGGETKVHEAGVQPRAADQLPDAELPAVARDYVRPLDVGAAVARVNRAARAATRPEAGNPLETPVKDRYADSDRAHAAENEAQAAIYSDVSNPLVRWWRERQVRKNGGKVPKGKERSGLF